MEFDAAARDWRVEQVEAPHGGQRVGFLLRRRISLAQYGQLLGKPVIAKAREQRAGLRPLPDRAKLVGGQHGAADIVPPDQRIVQQRRGLRHRRQSRLECRGLPVQTLDNVQFAQCEPVEQATQCKLLMNACVRSVIDNDVEVGRRCREAREIAVRPQIALNEPETRMPGMGEVADVEAIDLGMREYSSHMTIDGAVASRSIGPPPSRLPTARPISRSRMGCSRRGGKDQVVEGGVIVPEADGVPFVATVFVGELGKGDRLRHCPARTIQSKPKLPFGQPGRQAKRSLDSGVVWW